MRSLSKWLAWQEKLHPHAIDMGLDRVRHTLEALGWQRPRYPIVTVAGTNGKGSCVALTASILRAAGYRVGTFTSPHLFRYNERIRIDGSEISDASLCEAFIRIDAARGSHTLTFFEFNTLAALLVFETAGLDAMILEVGMGGRLDAVNAVDADVAIVTAIALDHCEWLGDDVEDIGREKAGIFRATRPAIFGDLDMPSSIETEAGRVGAELRRLGRDFRFTPPPGAPERPYGQDARWQWWGKARHEEDLPLPRLVGREQFANASTVLAALETLAERLPVSSEQIAAGLRAVELAGRFQVLAGDPPWIFDVAHNPDAAWVLADNLRTIPVEGRTLAICGILSDKDAGGIVKALAGSVDGWIVAGLTGARALSAAGLAERLAAAGAHVEYQAENVVAACAWAREYAHRKDRIVVFGSFLTVGPALKWAGLI